MTPREIISDFEIETDCGGWNKMVIVGGQDADRLIAALDAAGYEIKPKCIGAKLFAETVKQT